MPSLPDPGPGRPFRPSPAAWAGAVALLLAVAALGLAWAAGFLDRDAVHRYGDFAPRRRPIAALLLSGDMGLRFGMGPVVASALAAHGIPVTAISSPALFGRHRTRAEVDAIVANAVRGALADAHADRLILVGQSFGSDMLAVGAPALPPDLRARIAAITLVVPAPTAYFRADPTGIAYLGAPDADTRAAMRGLDWAPVTCIYGQREAESLCPLLTGPRVRSIGLPGGHYLHYDSRRLIGVMTAALGPLLPPSPSTHRVSG